jgi:hypothetical protein
LALRNPLPPGIIKVSSAGAVSHEAAGVKTIPDSEVNGSVVKPMMIV